MNMKFKKKYISASIICSNFVNLKNDISLLEKGGVDFIHVDIMDGHFVPRLGIFPEIINSIKSLSKIPLDVHLMVDNPLEWLPIICKYNPKYIAIHAESTKHLHYVIQKINENSIKAGIVINPGTSLNVLDYLSDDLDLVVIMAINPGILGQKLIPSMLNKIKDLSDYRKKNKKKFLIEVDGGVTFESGLKMIKSGADILVCGSSTIFNQNKPLNIKIKEFRQILR